MNVSSITDHLAGPAAFASVIFLLAQLRQSANQEIRELIAQYNMRYIDVASRIPYEVIVEDKHIEMLHPEMQRGAKRALYDFFLLCDEQLILVTGRTYKARRFLGPLSRLGSLVQIRDVRVWQQAEKEWIAGITYNFNRFAFIQEFEDVCLKLDPKNPENCFKAIRDNIPGRPTLKRN
jgi:hypothetical protein